MVQWFWVASWTRRNTLDTKRGLLYLDKLPLLTRIDLALAIFSLHLIPLLCIKRSRFASMFRVNRVIFYLRRLVVSFRGQTKQSARSKRLSPEEPSPDDALFEVLPPCCGSCLELSDVPGMLL